MIPRGAEQRKRAGLDLDEPVLRADSKARIRWTPLADRDREWELVGGESSSLLVDGAEAGVPLVPCHRPDLLEWLSDKLGRGVVVEDDPALRVDEACPVGGGRGGGWVGGGAVGGGGRVRGRRGGGGRGTEEQRYFRRRIRAYCMLFKTGAYRELFQTRVLSIAFTTFQGEKRRDQMRAWAHAELRATAEPESIVGLFYFSALPRPVPPGELFLGPIWMLPSDQPLPLRPLRPCPGLRENPGREATPKRSRSMAER